MITQQQVIDTARSWLGVPFLHQGRSRQGIDCIGLIIMVARELELVEKGFDSNGYGRYPDGSMVAKISDKCEQVSLIEPATILVICWNRDPYHVAIYTGPTIIHSNTSVGRVVEHGYRHPWPKLTLSIWRMPGVSYE